MTIRALVAVLALVLLPATMTVGPDAGSDATPAPSASQAYLDPETGRLGVPTSAQREAARARRAVTAPQPAAVQVERRDGMTIVRLPRERRVHVRATRTQDGDLHIEHGHAYRD